MYNFSFYTEQNAIISKFSRINIETHRFKKVNRMHKNLQSQSNKK